jgi:NAD(P)H-hydrate epimerase
VDILTARQMRRIDRRTIREFGIAEIVLMENAGAQTAAFLARTFDDLPALRLLFLCGPGNNGGDGFVAARHLHGRGIPLEIVLFARRADVGGSAAVNLKAIERIGIRPVEVTTPAAWRRARPLLEKADLVIDAIFGTGLSRPVGGLLARVFDAVNAADVEVVALDVPSGLSGDSAAVPGPCIAADHTVTFARPKVPHLFPPAEALCGDLHVVDVGIPPEAVAAEKSDLDLVEAASIAPLLPVRRADSHKGDYGHVLVVAGSRGKGGAARMASIAALRAGCGLVTAAVPAGIQGSFVARAMEIMTEGLPETTAGSLAARGAAAILRLLEGKKALAIGPGLTGHAEVRKLIRDVVGGARCPVVLDADGINAFAGANRLIDGRRRPMVLTPHPGEMGRLVGLTTETVQADRIEVARSFAREHGCWLVLKGHRTLAASPSGRVHVNPTGNPGMATAGSGDVLTGMLAGLIGQGLPVEHAVPLGVHLHGLAGDLAARRIGEMPLLARDILRQIPRALARIQRVGRPE